MAVFKGAGVAIVTPMHEDGSINYDKLEELIEYQIANSTDAIIICGTTGESSTMTHGEHLKTIKFAIDKTAGRVPVIAGTGPQLYGDSNHDVKGGGILWSRCPSSGDTVL